MKYPDPLRLLTYNVKHLSMDPAGVAQVVRACDPDVLALQEPPRWLYRGRLRALARATGMRVVVRGRGARTAAILVRDGIDCGRGSALRFRVWGARQRPAIPILRGAAMVWVRGVRVVVVHLSLDPVERARHVRTLLKNTANERPVTVITGDFNEGPGSATWSAFTGAGLIDAGAVCAADAGGAAAPTFPAAAPHSRIDGVFAGPEIEVVQCRTVNAPPAPTASDHLPILSVLRARS
ncbi:endonuclease/exonuclease/phosphatase family protein [Rarobacter incanus]|uniref:Endonuclease/exonuclease/phosphatase family metal-dependent hydrolase n=1 Tax=Rarobacter incanus TaxID=153494 RepID=A0A542SPB7_9MICO|nr:endonuclease/exonuclease/phosphatase family protein [Rarobacter incanus]TQK76408.1 endonuclease/exonuclease/phosphatase family metal-dependent hydrolase [Rarobacter incanus]